MALIDKFLEAIKPYVPKSEVEVIFDIGSRDLEQSIELHTAYPNAEIYAFEPNPESYAKCLEKKPDYITLLPYAILDYDGETSFYAVAQQDNHGASSVFEPTEFVVGVDRVNGLEKVTVPCRRIDTVAKELGLNKIDLVWADTQGCELPVLRSFGELLHGIEAIATEVATGALYYPNRKHTPTQYSELREFLESNGFMEVGRDQPWELETDVIYVKKP